MSRRKRGSRGGRRAAATSGSRRFRITMPMVIAVVAVAGIALIAFLIIQSEGSSSDGNEMTAESNDDPSLPGLYVDLPGIYGGSYPETAGHQNTVIDYTADGQPDPPVGGPHWSGACGEDPTEAPSFCGPAPLGIYREAWEPGTLVHNMEHGGVVVWYDTTDAGIRDQLEALIAARLPEDGLLVLAPYPNMEDEHIALTSWGRIDKFPVEEYSDARVNEFIDAHLRRFNPEGF